MQVLKGNIHASELTYIIVSICVPSQRFGASNPFAITQARNSHSRVLGIYKICLHMVENIIANKGTILFVGENIF